MVRRPPSATRTDTLVPYTTRCRSVADAGGEATNATTDDACDADEQAQLLFAMDWRRLTTFGFFEFSLAVFAVLGGAAQYAETVLGIEAWDPDLWQQVFAVQEEWILGLGPMAQVLAGIAAIGRASCREGVWQYG